MESAIFDDLGLRILVRSTTTYTRLHLHLMHPEFLKDGVDRSIELEWFARPLSGTTTPPKGRKLLYERERLAMENLDIPHFATSNWRSMEHEPYDEDLHFGG
jgi:lantibiotic modifying enzyme